MNSCTPALKFVLALLLSSLLAACSAAPSATPLPTEKATAAVNATPAAAPSATLLPGEKVIAIVNGVLIDGRGGEPIQDGVVLIQGKRILAAGPRATITVPAGAQVIDVQGGTILPGLINAHVHDGFNAGNLTAWAKAGVTTVRDEGMRTGRSLEEQIAWRDSIKDDPYYARLVSAGWMMTVPSGYGQLFVESPEDARQKVKDELDHGANLIKISMEDGYAGKSGLPKLTPEELAAIVSAAHDRKVLVSGHITQAAYMKPIVDAGVDDVAHLAYDPVPDETFQTMVAKGIYLLPTFTVFRNYGAPISTCVSNLARFVQMGGQVALGNDYGGGPGTFELGVPLYEIEQMTAAGMSPMQIILASTRNAAHVAGIEKEVGTLEPGKMADVLVVSEDPLKDPQNLAKTAWVIHAGTVIYPDAGSK